MTYHRKPLIQKIGSFTSHATAHYRDNVLFAITEQKRIHTYEKSFGQHPEERMTLDGRRRRLKAFCDYVKRGHHDMACYVYHVT